MRHLARLARLERTLRATADDPQVFANTQEAARLFRATYQREPSRADLWDLVRAAIPVVVDGVIVSNGVADLFTDEPIDYRRGLAAIAPRGTI